MMLGPDRIPRNEAIEIVGKEMFGPAWAGEASSEEWKLVQQYKTRFVDGTKVPTELADQLYKAEERQARADRQHREVIHWLENRGLDCVRGLKDGLDRKSFDAAFAKSFRRMLPTISKVKWRNPTDGPLIREALAALAEGKVSSVYQAAKLVCDRAAGNSYEQKLERLRKLIAKERKSASGHQ